jgi:RNA polymerase sigma factor (TIGR02999 family)
MDWGSGNREALDKLTPLVYDELRHLAARQLRGERPDHTLQSTALVHEAYLKLIDQQRVQWHDRDHFFAVASQVIRHILVSHARARNASKRGGGKTMLAFDEALRVAGRREMNLIALEDALQTAFANRPATRTHCRIAVLRRALHRRHSESFGNLASHREARLESGKSLAASPAQPEYDTWSLTTGRGSSRL